MTSEENKQHKVRQRCSEIALGQWINQQAFKNKKYNGKKKESETSNQTISC